MNLRGLRCPDCGRTVFRAACPCPLCGSDKAVEVDLSSAGIVETYTSMMGLVVGEVRLDDGTLVMGQIDAPEPQVGQRVVLRSYEEVAVFVSA